MISLSGLLDDADDADDAGDTDGTSEQELWELLSRRGYEWPGNADEAGAVLDRAGDERFRRRAALLGKIAAEQGPEQTLYEALLEGLGYRHNQQPFVRLAHAAPIEALRPAALAVLAQQRPMVLRHWLLTAAGLNNGAPGKLPAGLGPPMERKEWHLFRVRPSNHPAVRIGGAAELLARHLDRGLVATLGEAARFSQGG